MLTTTDLYQRPGYGIDFEDLVRFRLCRGLEAEVSKIFQPLKIKVIQKSQNPNSNRSITGTIRNYRPTKPGDLDIEGVTEDGYIFNLRLNQCRDLKILS